MNKMSALYVIAGVLDAIFVLFLIINCFLIQKAIIGIGIIIFIVVVTVIYTIVKERE